MNTENNISLTDIIPTDKNRMDELILELQSALEHESDGYTVEGLCKHIVNTNNIVTQQVSPNLRSKVYRAVQSFNLKPQDSYKKYVSFFERDDVSATKADWKSVGNDLWFAYANNHLLCKKLDNNE